MNVHHPDHQAADRPEQAGHPDEETLLDQALGLLEAGPRAGVEAHLAACATCRERARGLEAEQAALAAGLGGGVGADAARAVERRVLDGLFERPSRPSVAGAGPRGGAPRRRGPARRVLVAAALGLAAGGLVLFADQREQAVRRATLVQRVQVSERAALAGAR